MYKNPQNYTYRVNHKRGDFRDDLTNCIPSFFVLVFCNIILYTFFAKSFSSPIKV